MVCIPLRCEVLVGEAISEPVGATPSSMDFSTGPNLEGWLTIAVPATFKASILSSADGSPGRANAPAWPMIRPGTAFTPATRAAIGLCRSTMPFTALYFQ